MRTPPRRLPLSLGTVQWFAACVVVVHAVVAGFEPLPWLVLGVLLLADLRANVRRARLVGVEASKLRRSRLFWAGLGGTALVTLLAAHTWERLPQSTGWTLASDALGAGQWAAEIFVLVLGATTLAGEATSGTLKMMVPHAYARSDWVRAKAVVLVAAALCFTVVAAGVSVGYAAATVGLGDVVLEIDQSWSGAGVTHEVFRSADVMWDHLLAIVLVGSAGLVATGWLGLMLSSFFDNVVAALCLAFLVFAGLKFADVVLSLSQQGIGQDALQQIYTWHPTEMREALRGLGQALSSAYWDETLLARGLVQALVAGAAALLAAAAAFTRRDLHV